VWSILPNIAHSDRLLSTSIITLISRNIGLVVLVVGISELVAFCKLYSASWTVVRLLSSEFTIWQAVEYWDCKINQLKDV